jgi:hypothetical protein
MTSKREQVLDAVVTLITAAAPEAKVERNLAKPERIPPGGLVIVRDGDPGEPEVTLSPLTYVFSHRIPIEIAVHQANDPREQALDAILGQIGIEVAGNRTLWGLCDFLEAEAPATSDVGRAARPLGRCRARRDLRHP